MKWNGMTPEEARATLGINARPHLIKRLFAGLADMVILFFFHYMLYSLLLLTPAANTVNGYYADSIKLLEDYKVQATYAEEEVVDQNYKGDNYLHYNEDGDYYYIVKDKDFGEDTEAKKAAYQQYVTLANNSEEYRDKSFKYHLHNYIFTAVFAGGITEVIFFLAIPMIMNCGQTLGMMLFSIRMFNHKYAGKPRWYQYLGRFTFIFIIESLIPYLFLAEWILLAVPAVCILVMAIDREKHRALHDLVSGISYVEKKTFVDLYEEEPEPEIANTDDNSDKNQ